jgi:hypothetical protein
LTIGTALVLAALLWTVHPAEGWRGRQDSRPPEEKRLVVQQERRVVYEGRLDQLDQGEAEAGQQLRFTGRLGEYVVEIREGKVRMLSAQCPDKLCVRQGWTDHPANPIICLPQQVIISIEIEAAPAEAIDALSR